jgi:hypothetical protein
MYRHYLNLEQENKRLKEQATDAETHRLNSQLLKAKDDLLGKQIAKQLTFIYEETGTNLLGNRININLEEAVQAMAKGLVDLHKKNLELTKKTDESPKFEFNHINATPDREYIHKYFELVVAINKQVEYLKNFDIDLSSDKANWVPEIEKMGELIEKQHKEIAELEDNNNQDDECEECEEKELYEDLTDLIQNICLQVEENTPFKLIGVREKTYFPEIKEMGRLLIELSKHCGYKPSRHCGHKNA